MSHALAPAIDWYDRSRGANKESFPPAFRTRRRARNTAPVFRATWSPRVLPIAAQLAPFAYERLPKKGEQTRRANKNRGAGTSGVRACTAAERNHVAQHTLIRTGYADVG